MNGKSRFAAFALAVAAFGIAASGVPLAEDRMKGDGMAGAPMNDGMLNDLEIAHAAYTAGGLDIRYAHLSLAISENPNVRTFAQTMIRDHGAVNDAAVALIGRLKVTPQDNPLSRSLVDGAAKKRAELGRLTGRAFDCAYARNELGYHQVVNDTVANSFIPAVTVPDLKALLTDALATFRAHERHAAHMVAELGCGS